MYKTIIPLMNITDGVAQEILRAEVSDVLVVFPRVLRSKEMLNENIGKFMRSKAHLEAYGVHVGAWLAPSIGYGGTGKPSYSDNDAHLHYTRIRSVSGAEVYAYCPLDEAFTEDFLNTLCALVKTGVDFILFEDDFTLSGGKGIDVGCCCERHMREYRRRICEDIDRETLRERLLCDKENKYRDAWLTIQGKTLEDFTARIEQAVHAINPNCRVGLSANSSSFLLEGVEISQLAKRIAGKHKPFLRLTGAPYWKNAMTQSSNIEAIRLQTAWCGTDVEMISEADTYPRPRSWGPSAHMEMYDMILRADGATDGVLKYMIDYVSKVGFEPGYVDMHVENKRHYEEIERRFAGKTAVGLDVIEKTDTFRKMDFSEDLQFHEYGGRGYLPTVAQWFLCDNSIPTTYGQHGSAHLAFGVNAAYLTDEDLADGVITDAAGARILTEKGVDIGIRSMKRTEIPSFEYFQEEDDFTEAVTDAPGKFYEYTLSENVSILSEFVRVAVSGLLPDVESMKHSNDRFPACYLYTNGKKQRFMVYSFVAHSVYVTSGWHRGLFRNYYRQKQLARGIEFLQKRPLPAMCFGAPELYILCKKSENEMAVGFWNIYPDRILNPVFHLDKAYRTADFYRYGGRLDGDKLTLDKPVLPYDFGLVTLLL